MLIYIKNFTPILFYFIFMNYNENLKNEFLKLLRR